MKSVKKYEKTIAVIIISFTLSLIGSELLLQLLKFDLFVHQGILLSEGENKEFAYKATTFYHERRKEIEWYFDIDYKKIKNKPPHNIKLYKKTLTLSKNKKRVFCLGDSGTFGSGVKNYQTFCALLEKKYPELEFYNFGIPGKDLLHSLNELKALLSYRPDHVILGYFLSNDLNQTYSRWINDQNEDKYLYSISNIKKSSFKLINLINSLKVIIKFHFHKPILKHASQKMIITPEGLNLNDYIEGEFAFYLPDNTITNSAYELNSKLLREFRQLAIQQKFSFQILLIPTRSYLSKSYIHLPDNPDGLMYFKEKQLTFNQDELNFDKPMQRLINLCQRLDILCHNPSSTNTSTSILLENDDHLSIEGHKKSAKLIQFRD
jgi:lysophospholipase L1-like esterase